MAPTTVLTDDHIDLLMTAASNWHILTSRTTKALATGLLEDHFIAETATLAGNALRDANTAAIGQLAARGHHRLVDREAPSEYLFRPITTPLHPVEVIKAVHAADQACSSSPTWANSRPQRLIAAVITAAEHRLAGYGDAPWSWTRPDHRKGHVVGVAAPGDHPPQIPGLTWIDPTELREHWMTAPLVIIRPSAAPLVPADLPDHPTVVVLITDEEHHNEAWTALIELAMPASQVWFWPQCADWFAANIPAPANEPHLT